jgi:hypothetical protein
MLLASSGSAEAHTVEICSATGLHSRFQVSSVLSIQSFGQVHGVGDRGAGLLGHRRNEADGARRQLPGQVVVHRPGLLAAGHHVARAAEHLPEPAEELAELGHVEFGPAA